jgi:hypothetical protein
MTGVTSAAGIANPSSFKWWYELVNVWQGMALFCMKLLRYKYDIVLWQLHTFLRIELYCNKALGFTTSFVYAYKHW